MCLSVSLSVCLSVSLSVCLFVCLSVCLSGPLTAGAQVRVAIFPFRSLFTCLSRLSMCSKPTCWHNIYKYSYLISDIDSNYPGVIFFGQPVIKRVTFSEAVEIDGIGISLSVPKNSLSSLEDSVELCVRPCFHGPFKLPDNYESASPAYLIHPEKDLERHLCKDITIRMHHHACLQSEDDCRNMTFLSANSTPEYSDSNPVYTFTEIKGTRGTFQPGGNIGEISLSHFCKVKIGIKRQRGEEEQASEEKKQKG